jgi:hypothetical protein
VTDNVLSGGAYGIIGSGTGVGSASWTAFAPDGSFLRNVLVIAPEYVSQFPTGNSYPASLAAIGFANLASNDFHLAAASPFKAATGRDPGADVDVVNSATNGVIVP